MRTLMGLAMTVLAPVGLVGAGVSRSRRWAGVLQTGGIQIHPQVVGFKVDRINPLSQSEEPLFAALGGAAGQVDDSGGAAGGLCGAAHCPPVEMPPFSSVRLIALGGDAYDLLLAAAWLLFAWAAIDYLVEWHSREQRLKMSRQEMREEFKESEGNPQIRGASATCNAAARRRRMQADVPGLPWWSPTPLTTRWPWPSISRPWKRPRCWPRGAICSPRRSRSRLAGRECRFLKILRWRARSIARSSRASRFRSSFMPLWLDSGIPLPPAGRAGAAPAPRTGCGGSGSGRQPPGGSGVRQTSGPTGRAIIPAPRDRVRGGSEAKAKSTCGTRKSMSTAVTVQAPESRLKGIWNRLGEFLLPLGAISVMFVMLVPLSAGVLDMLLALSIAASVIVFLSAVQVRRAVELSVFPTLLLLLTLFRLALNIASSRRILLHGSEGTAAAGKVIEAFGQFVVGGNYVVGFVLFLALIAIQFLVVSHGAVRTAEVTARFTLDALPGKQMAIDADMNAGLIDEQDARKRRQAIAREAEFYGAMDGAARSTSAIRWPRS
jgi:hypothetical protein